MNAIVNFLEGIGNVITSLFGFVVSFFSDLGWIINTLSWAVGIIPNLLGWIPAPILSLITLTLSVVMIYKIMGREG